jgi:phospholipase D1/2
MLVLVVAYMLSSDDSQRYRHGSFAPVRERCKAVWYVDGKDYMSAVGEAIMAAETEIMITDWQMNPEIFMKRPDSGVDGLEWRLDNMLLRKAENGVKVKIILYKEMKRALDLGSDHVVEVFEKLKKHKNIEVHRHPGFFTGLLTLFRWSHHEKMVVVDGSIAFVGGIDLCYGRWDTRKHDLMDNYPVHPDVHGSQDSDDNPRNHELMDNYRVHSALDESQTLNDNSHKYARWIGKDYRNTFYNKEKKTDWEKPLDGYDGVERNEIPRLPWHDVSCAFTGKAVQDAVQHFTDRYNAITKPWWRRYSNFFRQYFQSTNQIKQSTKSKNTKAEEIVSNSSGYNVKSQLLRSVDNWSAGQKHEASIYNAYIDAIKNAQHFIYIENQFFISSQKGFLRKVQNDIQAALVERIIRAHRANEDFYVMVITPLKPEFPGDWDADDWTGETLRAVAFWNQATIYHGEDSLFSKLEKENIPKETAMKYFSVYGLRKYDLIGKHFVTEIVYVHSKIMIVDDRKAIIGSANINDRSMLGGRDSEIAVMIEDLDFIDGNMNGIGYKMGTFAHSLRCDLLKEHLGLVGKSEEEFDIRINDPLADGFIKGVHDRAIKNTRMFLEAFGQGLLPRDDVEDFEALKRYKDIPLPRKNTPQAREILKQITGTLANHTHTFLKKELKPSKFLGPVMMNSMAIDANQNAVCVCILAKAGEDTLVFLVKRAAIGQDRYIWDFPIFFVETDSSDDKAIVSKGEEFVRKEFEISLSEDQGLSNLKRDVYPLYSTYKFQEILFVLTAEPKKLTGESANGQSTKWLRSSEIQEIAVSSEDYSWVHNFEPPAYFNRKRHTKKSAF